MSCAAGRLASRTSFMRLLSRRTISPQPLTRRSAMALWEAGSTLPALDGKPMEVRERTRVGPPARWIRIVNTVQKRIPP
jgi:hypothetical protein